MKNELSDLEKQVRASAVMEFANLIRGAYLHGFIDNNPTVYDVYRSAQNHVKDNFGIDTENWDDSSARKSRLGNEELNELRKENEALKVAYGDNWYDGFMAARDRVLSGECIEDYATETILSLSEVAEEEKVNKAKSLNSK